MKALLRLLAGPTPLRLHLLREIARRIPLLGYRHRLALGAVERPHYGHCIFAAAELAARLNYPKMSAIEFGCGGGNGLLDAEMHISEITKIIPIKIELYGFDTGSGLPDPRDYRDFPHYFKAGQFAMEQDTLKQRLKLAKLVLGDVNETCKNFFSDYSPAPIGCVFCDLDFYSSTRDALTIFDADPTFFLPRIFMYFDDVVGDNIWLVSEFAGEPLAIDEFNRNHVHKKIAANRYMPLIFPKQWWPHHIFVCHDFQHPHYSTYVAEPEIMRHEGCIRLR